MNAGAAYTVHLFGPARTAVGAASTRVAVAAPATAGALLQALAAAHPELAHLLPRSRVAVNHSYVDAAAALAPGDEVAIIPPVGGG
ncbi:MAG: MoaD/ThiS family protein [Gemmatimonadota bacterium]